MTPEDISPTTNSTELERSLQTRIAVLDDDEHWCIAIQRFFRKEFSVTSFKGISSLLRELEQYDLAIIDFSIPGTRHDIEMNGCELIRHIKQTIPHPPLLILATAFISKNDVGVVRHFCDEADAFLAKDAGLDFALAQVKKMLAAKMQ